MAGVLGRPALKRQDLIISTVADQSIGFRWWRSPDGGQTREPMDLTGYTGVAEFRGANGYPWLETDMEIGTYPSDPLVTLVTRRRMFVAPEWNTRSNGEYHIILTSPVGIRTCIAAGYLYLDR